jgi:hypothetical protein
VERVITTLDEMIRDGIMEDYVIGGATALAYYSDNVFTEDIDVFVYLKSSPGYLIDLNPIYEYLTKAKHARIEGQYIVLDGFPLQFLVPYDDLSSEAFSHPQTVMYGNLKTKVLKLEYLMAIMIQLGKQKYRERMRRLIEEDAYDNEMLEKILRRHALAEKWHTLKKNLEG